MVGVEGYTRVFWGVVKGNSGVNQDPPSGTGACLTPIFVEMPLGFQDGRSSEDTKRLTGDSMKISSDTLSPVNTLKRIPGMQPANDWPRPIRLQMSDHPEWIIVDFFRGILNCIVPNKTQISTGMPSDHGNVQACLAGGAFVGKSVTWTVVKFRFLYWHANFPVILMFTRKASWATKNSMFYLIAVHTASKIIPKGRVQFEGSNYIIRADFSVRRNRSAISWINEW